MKYVAKIKFSDIKKISIVFGSGKSLATLKNELGCDFIINGGLYDMNTNKPVCHLKVDGTVYSKETWNSWGYCWNSGNDIKMLQVPDKASSYNNYLTCVSITTPYDGPTKQLSYNSAVGGVRGRSAIGTTTDSLVLYCSSDGSSDAKSPEGLRTDMLNLGC